MPCRDHFGILRAWLKPCFYLWNIQRVVRGVAKIPSIIGAVMLKKTGICIKGHGRNVLCKIVRGVAKKCNCLKTICVLMFRKNIIIECFTMKKNKFFEMLKMCGCLGVWLNEHLLQISMFNIYCLYIFF